MLKLESSIKFLIKIGKRSEKTGKIKSISNLIKLGLSIEQIAEALELDRELVRKVAQSSQN